MTTSLISRWVLVCLLFSPVVTAAQARWQNLEQLQPGQRLTVIDHQLKSQTCTFVSFSDSSLIVRFKDGEKSIPREDVYRITTPGSSHRGRNAIIGLAAGVAVGAGLTGAVAHMDDVSAGDAAGAIAGTAAIGAGIGALIGPSKTIYKAERRAVASADTAASQPEMVRAE